MASRQVLWEGNKWKTVTVGDLLQPSKASCWRWRCGVFLFSFFGATMVVLSSVPRMFFSCWLLIVAVSPLFCYVSKNRMVMENGCIRITWRYYTWPFYKDTLQVVRCYYEGLTRSQLLALPFPAPKRHIAQE